MNQGKIIMLVNNEIIGGVNLDKRTEKQLVEIKEEFEKKVGKSLTEKEVFEICLAIIHNGIFKKGWKVKDKISKS